MRPNSRGAIGSSAGGPPGTGGMRRPGSGGPRLRTGAAPSGHGTQAAQGMAINASVNVSDRPVTGQGVKGMKAQGGGGGRLVYDTAYYVGTLRKKINDVNNETIKLRTEIDQQSRDSSQYVQLEKRYETLLKNKETLEGQLADYNLALDKTRTSTDPEDVQQMAMHMADKNRQAGQDLDRIFMQRKQREQETAQIEEQIEQQYRAIQQRINELEPGKLRAYNELLARQRELQERVVMNEQRLNETNGMIRHYESDEKSNSLRKEYVRLEKDQQSLQKDVVALKEELDIASLDPREANNKFTARVNDFKEGAKRMEERAAHVREEIAMAKKNLEEMDTVTEEDSAEIAKYDLLVKRDQEMTAFIDSFETTRTGILQEQQTAQDTIVLLLEDISKGLEDSASMPSMETHAEMEDAKTFKMRTLEAAKDTMKQLLVEKAKRERELDLLRTSEPKITAELSELRDKMVRMRSEMEVFQDLERMRREHENTMAKLGELKQTYIKRRDTMRQQIQGVSVEFDNLKKALASNETAKEIDETEKRLKHFERSIFELREFVDSKSRETDFEMVKANCLKVTNALNAAVIRQAQISGGGGMYGAQAKGSW
mmetsp:Transcript_65909/g.129665  ORF Transcript_65909/g.129665 Transcript_65909/m.129665 type:complete len:600 (+) Transcript_65909:57-1856(+)|eukprot:CAMPEP_0170370768 /NCGR_PEP_ID=MMETSP0117_2-20130122/8683_1 /TAXON_ID=400756 /ORGANISM="Durinskia baltica, Strain CSIRO CS-38" /LENGTH=599 /DNA_ID=CAMNT_0010625557 /DNA_START=52 /DNA_END=1851 /DNA_ORIENTATION=-